MGWAGRLECVAAGGSQSRLTDRYRKRAHFRNRRGACLGHSGVGITRFLTIPLGVHLLQVHPSKRAESISCIDSRTFFNEVCSVGLLDLPMPTNYDFPRSHHSQPRCLTVTRQLPRDFSALPSPWVMALHRTEIVDRCPMQFPLASSQFVLALSCATNLTDYQLLWYRRSLLRSSSGYPFEDSVVADIFPRNNYIIADIYGKTMEDMGKFFTISFGRRELTEVNSHNRDEGNGY